MADLATVVAEAKRTYTDSLSAYITLEYESVLTLTTLDNISEQLHTFMYRSMRMLNVTRAQSVPSCYFSPNIDRNILSLPSDVQIAELVPYVEKLVAAYQTGKINPLLGKVEGVKNKLYSLLVENVFSNNPTELEACLEALRDPSIKGARVKMLTYSNKRWTFLQGRDSSGMRTGDVTRDRAKQYRKATEAVGNVLRAVVIDWKDENGSEGHAKQVTSNPVWNPEKVNTNLSKLQGAWDRLKQSTSSATDNTSECAKFLMLAISIGSEDLSKLFVRIAGNELKSASTTIDCWDNRPI